MENVQNTSLENAAKLLMKGLMAIAVAIAFSALCNLFDSKAPSENHFQMAISRSPDTWTQYLHLINTKTGDIYMQHVATKYTLGEVDPAARYHKLETNSGEWEKLGSGPVTSAETP